MADNRSFGEILFNECVIMNVSRDSHRTWYTISELDRSVYENIAKTLLIAYCKGMYERTENERAAAVMKLAPTVTREQATAISRDMMRIR